MRLLSRLLKNKKHVNFSQEWQEMQTHREMLLSRLSTEVSVSSGSASKLTFSLASTLSR